MCHTRSLLHVILYAAAASVGIAGCGSDSPVSAPHGSGGGGSGGAGLQEGGVGPTGGSDGGVAPDTDANAPDGSKPIDKTVTSFISDDPASVSSSNNSVADAAGGNVGLWGSACRSSRRRHRIGRESHRRGGYHQGRGEHALRVVRIRRTCDCRYFRSREPEDAGAARRASPAVRNVRAFRHRLRHVLIIPSLGCVVGWLLAVARRLPSGGIRCAQSCSHYRDWDVRYARRGQRLAHGGRCHLRRQL